jgi:pimeloyl-ACP methyl ester carboxylesterase
MPVHQRGDVRIRYEEVGSGFPLLVVPGGGLNSRISNWQTAVFNAMEEFKHDFRCITMDQRNANGGESSGPVPVENAWDAFADDQLGLMDHLGIREFFYMGYCIGGCFAGKLLERAPQRVVAAVFCQTVGHRPEDPDVMVRHSQQNWLADFRTRRPEVSMETIERYLHSLWRVQPDFLYSVPRALIGSCRTPILVLPDDTPSHPLRTSIDIASLAPKAEITVFPWREPPDLKVRTINRVSAFLKSHVPKGGAAQ